MRDSSARSMIFLKRMFKAGVLSKKTNGLFEGYPQIMRETIMRRQEVKKTKTQNVVHVHTGISKK